MIVLGIFLISFVVIWLIYELFLTFKPSEVRNHFATDPPPISDDTIAKKYQQLSNELKTERTKLFYIFRLFWFGTLLCIAVIGGIVYQYSLYNTETPFNIVNTNNVRVGIDSISTSIQLDSLKKSVIVDIIDSLSAHQLVKAQSLRDSINMLEGIINNQRSFIAKNSSIDKVRELSSELEQLKTAYDDLSIEFKDVRDYALEKGYGQGGPP